MGSCIEIKNVSKKFGNVLALDHVSIKLDGNKIYGLLGRNGAGKSTLLNIISNKIFADEGEITINGEYSLENDKAQGMVYSTSEKTYYPEDMKIRNVFKYTKLFYPDFDEKYAYDLSKKFGLNINKKVDALSTGYDSIFKLIIALSVNVPYIFLDEPVIGLDANHREMFYRILIERYSESPSMVVLSTHLIEEISGLLEEIIIIDNGKIIKSESRDNLLKKGYSVSGRASVVDSYIKDKEVMGEDNLGGLKTAHILGELDQNIPDELDVSRLDLQKLFIQLTKKGDE